MSLKKKLYRFIKNDFDFDKYIQTIVIAKTFSSIVFYR